MNRVMNSAHEECSGNAACAQGDGPCVASLRDRIDADTALLEECKDYILHNHRDMREADTDTCLRCRLDERLEVK